MKIGTRILGVLEIPSKMGGLGGAMPIMMPLMELMDPDGPGCSPAPSRGSTEITTNRCSVETKFNDRGDIQEVNITTFGNHDVVVTLNGKSIHK